MYEDTENGMGIVYLSRRPRGGNRRKSGPSARASAVPAGSRWRVFAANRLYLRLRPCRAGQGDGQARRVSFTTHRAPGRLVGSTFMIRYF